jgi:serine/threonine-protein phosphatase 5
MLDVSLHCHLIVSQGKAIELDPNYVKAYYRRALCQLSVLRPQLAVADFKKSLALEPQNKLARTQLDATTKHIRRLQFEAVRWIHHIH